MRYLAALLLVLAACAADSDNTPSETETSSTVVEPETRTAEQAANTGFVWGYPAVVSARTLAQFSGLIGVNKLFWGQQLAGPASRIIVAPNRDTLYSIAVLDLAGGPLVLTVPAVTDRYYAYQFLDPWTESFAYIGTRATDGEAGSWVITPPGWKGTLPEGAHQIETTTEQVFLLGRFRVVDEADVANVMAIRDQVSLLPLDPSTAGDLPPVAPAVGRADATGTNGIEFWDELGVILERNPPSGAASEALLAELGELGVGPGRIPSQEVTDPETVALLEEAAKNGLASVMTRAGEARPDASGWRVQTEIGTYGDDWDLRALVARIGWGANVPEEAVYPTSRRDSSGAAYSGGQRYTMHFDADELPKVDAFWSLTVYGPDMFFVEHPFGRYSIGDGLLYNADGSLDVVLQHEEPDAGTSNWLPTPAGEFNLMARLYLPTPASIAAGITLPPVERVESR